MKNKTLFLFIIVALYHIIYACCHPLETYYDWNEIISNNLDNSYDVPLISENDSIAKEAYGIRIEIIPDNNYIASNWSLINSAYATSCPEYSFAKSTIEKLQIYTLEKFDNEHLENSEITEYFGVRNVGDNYSQYNEINEFLSSLNQSIETADWYLKPDMDLYLLQAPDEAGLYHYIIELSFSKQKALIDTVVVNLY